MTRIKTLNLVLLATLVWAAFNPALSDVQAQRKTPISIRPSILAGTWYPGSPDMLRKTILNFLRRANVQPTEGALKAIIVPHAGYRYSGQVAAHAYKLLRARDFSRVILIGPSHRIPFEGVSVNLQEGYRTPLGIVRVDVDMAKAILRAAPSIHWYQNAHAAEHSLEIQLPFLQTVLKDFVIVPILMGSQDYKTCKMLSRVLSSIVSSAGNTLLLASSDLSHYHDYLTAKRLDSRFIELVKKMDTQGLYEALRTGLCEACGGGPVITVLLVSKALGANRVVILNAANSGDVTGEKHTVVGYMAGAVFTSSGKGQHPK